METVFKMILMTSLYASISGIIILALKRLLKNKISPKWQYIIWIVLIFKLIVPFGPESVISFFNAVPKVSQNIQNINFEQTYREYHKTIMYMQQKKPDISNGYKVKDKSLHLVANIQKGLPYIWVLGVILMCLWLIYSNYSLYKKIQKSRIIIPQDINKIFDECKCKMNISRNIEIVTQNAITTPAIFGVLKPKVLLSPEISSLEDKQVSYIFLHELTHYKRKDLLVNYILVVLQAIHWFNPIIWYCFKTIRQDMEAATDEMVLNILDSDQKKEYGKALLAVLENFNSLKIAPRLIGMADDKKSIERRIKMIKMSDFFKGRRKMVIVTGMLCIAILSGGLLTRAVTKTAASNKNSNITIVAGPSWYSPFANISKPAIGILVKYSGKADKVRYSVDDGVLMYWDRNITNKITKYGKSVEFPINKPIYWNCTLKNGKVVNKKKTTINISVLNNSNVVAEKQVIINRNNDNFNIDKSSGFIDKGIESIEAVSEKEKNSALKVVKKYFEAFSKADYNAMKTLATEHHNKLFVHSGDVFGMKWAKAKKIRYWRINHGVISFGIDVDMETAKTSALYPAKETFFFVQLVKDSKGIWKVDDYATGL